MERFLADKAIVSPSRRVQVNTIKLAYVDSSLVLTRYW